MPTSRPARVTSWLSAAPSSPTPIWYESCTRGGPFNEGNRATYYGGGEAGYTDYPALAA